MIPKVSNILVDTSGQKLPTTVAHRCPKDECADKKLFSCYGFAGKGRISKWDPNQWKSPK